MRTSRLLGTAIAICTFLGLSVAPASAAPPVNDVRANASTSVNVEGFDATEATTDLDDDEAAAACGVAGTPTDASVWFYYDGRAEGDGTCPLLLPRLLCVVADDAVAAP